MQGACHPPPHVGSVYVGNTCTCHDLQTAELMTGFRVYSHVTGNVPSALHVLHALTHTAYSGQVTIRA
jgi:hypothetical protein